MKQGFTRPAETIILPPGARRARAAYLAEWRDRMMLARCAGVTNRRALDELTLAEETGVEPGTIPA